MAKGRPRTQNRTIDAIREIASSHGYKVSTRSKDTNQRTLGKKFLPDVIGVPVKGNAHRVFEVEATVTNNTLFKSITSLATYLMEHQGSHGHLIVPAKHKQFTDECVKHFAQIIRAFGKTAKGANKKFLVDAFTFEQVKEDETKVKKWETNGRLGQPPKCKYLPRPQ